MAHDLRPSSSPGVCRITGSATVCSDHQYKGTLDVFIKIIRQVRAFVLSFVWFKMPIKSNSDVWILYSLIVM